MTINWSGNQEQFIKVTTANEDPLCLNDEAVRHLVTFVLRRCIMREWNIYISRQYCILWFNEKLACVIAHCTLIVYLHHDQRLLRNRNVGKHSDLLRHLGFSIHSTILRKRIITFLSNWIGIAYKNCKLGYSYQRKIYWNFICHL